MPAWAERDTQEPNTRVGWRYHSMTNQGRLYYGFNSPLDQPTSPEVIFDEPTLELPCPLYLGHTWSRYVSWSAEILGVPAVFDFFATAHVDAYGTIVLPGLGERPALRVKEKHNYEASLFFLGTWIPAVSQTNFYYYWLTPKVGVVAEVFLLGENVLNPQPLSHTNTFLRMFESSAVPTPVAGLRIRSEPARRCLIGLPAPTTHDTASKATGW